ncbi:uncharacterized protein LOC132706420 isoform X2 [Cylas formicarius]|uniref:uncharacterized protein LOC132706420 isoform X2 n=1 Tax=Cylas formicarius TaxID=197179 RepID=UPI002958AC67|nr:uncharacterized protein LOC132706420 isoform X2 [Cylas formicarius]
MPLNKKTVSFHATDGGGSVYTVESRVMRARQKFENMSVSANTPKKKAESFVRPSTDKFLTRNKSFSVEIITELKKNKKFNERRDNLENRLSKSFNNVESYPATSNVAEKVSKFETSKETAPDNRKSLSLDCLTPNTIKSVEELLKSFNQTTKDKFDKPLDNKFPVADDENIEFRRKPSIQKNRVSKTTDFDFRRRRLTSPNDAKNFEIRGLVKFQLPNQKIITKLNEDYIAYENEIFYRINSKMKTKELIKKNVVLKGARYLNKNKEVELKDTSNLAYILYFDSLKYAKEFMENEKIQIYFNNESKTTIKKTLLRFLGKRSSREILEKKGIYKNEPIFGNTLRDIYSKCGTEVPTFIYRTIELIERPENIKSLGLYRTSGNLATIQKIRFEVDNGRLEILSQFTKDPDVLTGSLKLFFRELKEPLIPLDVSDKLLEIAKLDQSKLGTKDLNKLRSILVNDLCRANLITLSVMLKHLLEVVKYKDENKMDAYNLAVCWGPSMVFGCHNGDHTPEYTRDIVTQSQDATRLVDFLLGFYARYPGEMASLSRGVDTLEPKSPLLRQESKDSFSSSDSSSKGQRKDASNLSLSVDEGVRKMIELIESGIESEGLYKKSGSVDRSNKILKKIVKKKFSETDKNKNDIHDLTDALKRYLRESGEVLVTKEAVEQVLFISGDNKQVDLDVLSRRKIWSIIEDTPKKDTLIYILRHLAKVVDHQPQHKVTKTDIINIWTKVLNYRQKVHKSDDHFSRFLTISVETFAEGYQLPLPDVVRQSFGNSAQKSGNMTELLKDLKSHQERDRFSRYDNVDSDVVGEASILDDKTERTKL